MKQLPFRIGTTSYIWPGDLVENAHFLADRVEDMELVLFDVEGGQNNYPDMAVLQELRAVSEQKGLSYTVHLPHDLHMAPDGSSRHESMLKARKAIECTLGLAPWSYVAHLDGRELLDKSQPDGKAQWNQQAVRALKQISAWAGGPKSLAVENLDHYPPDFVDEVLEQFPASRCIDIGHLWCDGHDPLPFLQKHISRASVLHLHGVAERDHSSLCHMPEEELSRVISFIENSGFSGVLTLEVFGQDDFESSLEALYRVL